MDTELRRREREEIMEDEYMDQDETSIPLHSRITRSTTIRDGDYQFQAMRAEAEMMVEEYETEECLDFLAAVATKHKEERSEKDKEDNPRSWKEALAGSDPEGFKKSVEKEFGDLERRCQCINLTENYWSKREAAATEEDKREIDLGWIDFVRSIEEEDRRLVIGILLRFSTKRDYTGVLLRRKTRCALRGDRDATKFYGRYATYAPTAKWHTNFLMVALSAWYGRRLHSIDITAAFGYSPYSREEPMYFRKPADMSEDNTERIYQVNCDMYGLNNASNSF